MTAEANPYNHMGEPALVQLQPLGLLEVFAVDFFFRNRVFWLGNLGAAVVLVGLEDHSKSLFPGMGLSGFCASTHATFVCSLVGFWSLPHVMLVFAHSYFVTQLFVGDPNTRRIIPASKRLITMVSKSPK